MDKNLQEQWIASLIRVARYYDDTATLSIEGEEVLQPADIETDLGLSEIAIKFSGEDHQDQLGLLNISISQAFGDYATMSTIPEELLAQDSSTLLVTILREDAVETANFPETLSVDI